MHAYDIVYTMSNATMFSYHSPILPLLGMVKTHTKTSGINPRDEICYFSDKKFILFLILSPEMVTPGLDLEMYFTLNAKGTEYFNSVPVGTEFQNDLRVQSILTDLSRWSF